MEDNPILAKVRSEVAEITRTAPIRTRAGSDQERMMRALAVVDFELVGLVDRIEIAVREFNQERGNQDEIFAAMSVAQTMCEAREAMRGFMSGRKTLADVLPVLTHSMLAMGMAPERIAAMFNNPQSN